MVLVLIIEQQYTNDTGKLFHKCTNRGILYKGSVRGHKGSHLYIVPTKGLTYTSFPLAPSFAHFPTRQTVFSCMIFWVRAIIRMKSA